MSDWFGEEQATFGDRLCHAREAAGLEQRELAMRLGVSERTVRNWENDRSEPRSNRMQMLAGMLNVSLMWLMSGRGEGIAPPGEETPPRHQGIDAALRELARLRTDLARVSRALGAVEARLRQSAGRA